MWLAEEVSGSPKITNPLSTQTDTSKSQYIECFSGSTRVSAPLSSSLPRSTQKESMTKPSLQMHSPGAGTGSEEPSTNDADVARARREDVLRMVDVRRMSRCLVTISEWGRS